MLSTDKENSNSSGWGGEVKGRHVKRLNFGQPLLQLSSVNELEAGNEEVIGIRSVRKDDLVRKWLVSHAEGDRENVSVHPLSPVCGTYVSHLLESPVLGSRSRRRPKLSVAANTCDRIERPAIGGESSKDAERSKMAGSPVLGKVSSTSRKKRKNDETRTYSVHPLSPAKTTDIPSSPVTDASFAPKKRKSLCEGKLNTFKRHTKRRYVDTNMNSVKLILNPSNRFCYRSKLVSRSTFTEPQEYKIPQTCSVLDLFKSKSQVRSEGIPSDEKECLQIETSSSDENLQENLQNSLRCCSDSEKTASDLIEDDESQHFSKRQDIPLLRRESKTAITSEQEMRSDDSPIDSQASESTSRVATASGKDIRIDELSNPMDLGISEASSPPSMMSSAGPCPNLLDSGKKRRKPRKGSLLARLQLLINREKSFLRVWQHQTKNAESDKIQVPCILFCVKKYLTHFNKYFLEGDVVDDSSNLLTNVSWITVIIISEITGVLHVKCGNVLKIYPPWDVVNLAGTAIIARKLSVVSCSNNINIQCAIEKTETITTIEEHACPCTMEDTVVPNCKQLHSYVKPNVLMYILES